jgi:hypothetical protein
MMAWTRCAFAALLLLAGCASSRVEVNASSGTAATSSSAGVQVRASDGLARAIVVMALIGAAVEYNREERPFPDAAALLPGNSPSAPPLAPGRTVAEQDCSRPVDLFSGNLKCR